MDREGWKGREGDEGGTYRSTTSPFSFSMVVVRWIRWDFRGLAVGGDARFEMWIFWLCLSLG